MKGHVVCALAACLGAVPAAAAEPAPRVVALSVERAAGAEACADETRVGQFVRARLGRDPFDATADASIRVALRVARNGFVAEVVLAGEPGFSGARTLRSAGPGCDELIQTLALALAVAIDPLALWRTPEPPRVDLRRRADTDVTLLRLARLAPEPTPPPPPVTLRWRIAAAAGGGLGLSPGPTLAPRLGVHAVIGSWEARAGIVAHVLGSRDFTGGRVESTLIAAILGACRGWTAAELCLVVAAGPQLHRGEGVTVTADQTSAFVAPGVRGGARLALDGRWTLVLDVTAYVPLTRARLTVGDALVWETPSVAGAATLGLTYEIE